MKVSPSAVQTVVRIVLILIGLQGSVLSAQHTRAISIEVRLTMPLSSATAKTGQGFDGVVIKAVTDGNKVVIPEGTAVQGKVVYSKPDGALGAPGILRLQMTTLGGQRIQSTLAFWEGDSQGDAAPGARSAGKRAAVKGEAVISRNAVVSFRVESLDGVPYTPRRP
jgi:hypothetical protein